MKVVFLQDVEGKDKEGDIKEVPVGYTQNYLIKNNSAKEAAENSINRLAGQKKAQEEHEAGALEEAKKLKESSEEKNTVVELKAKIGENSRLLGSIPSKQIAEGLSKQYKIKLDKRKIELENPIHSLGYINVSVKLHHEVTATTKVHVIQE